MASPSTHRPPSAVWVFMDVSADGRRMSCKAPSCTYRDVAQNATRARRHLLACRLALAHLPGIAVQLATPDGGEDRGAGPDLMLPPLPDATLAKWRLQFSTLQLESGLPFSTFDTPRWRSMLHTVCGGRFDGPGGRRVVGGALLSDAVAAVDARVSGFTQAADALSNSMDGMTDVNGGGVYDVIVYTPTPLLVSTFRLGSESASADVLLTRLGTALPGPLLDGIATSSGMELQGGATPLSLFTSRRLLALVTDSPSTMVALRTRAVDAGTFLYAFGCAAHAGNLIAQDAARVTVCAQALRAALVITVFFTRSTRARSLLASVRSRLSTNEGTRVGSLRSYSRTRWAGEGATIAAIGDNLPALRHTLLENEHAAAPFEVPDAVSRAVASPAAAASITKCAPFLNFLARLVTVLEGDATPLSAYTGVFACLRASLANNFATITVPDRQALQGTLQRRFASFSDPMVVLAFFLDPCWSPVRARLLCLLRGGQSLVALRDAAVDRLCLSDAAAKAALLTELAGFAALEVQHAGHAASRDLHPVLWWRLWGASLQVLQPLAVRLLSTPPSAAGGERMLKTLKGVLSTQRNRLAPQRADTQTRLAFNARQMRRACLIAGYRRSEAEIQLLAMLNGEVGAGAPVAGPMAPVADDGGAASEGDESSGEFEEGTSTARLTEDATVERLWGSDRLEAAVDYLMQ